MTIVAFLQNQWFKHPDRIRAAYARYPEDRHTLNAAYLFMGCLTGKRIKDAFGEELCESIIWENASPQIAGESAGVFPADLGHIQSVLAETKPSIVIAFGRIACPALSGLKSSGAQWRLITGPHPANRQPSVFQELRRMAAELKEAVESTIG